MKILKIQPKKLTTTKILYSKQKIIIKIMKNKNFDMVTDITNKYKVQVQGLF